MQGLQQRQEGQLPTGGRHHGTGKKEGGLPGTMAETGRRTADWRHTSWHGQEGGLAPMFCSTFYAWNLNTVFSKTNKQKKSLIILLHNLI